MPEEHICNPKVVDFYGTITYQCKCGKYFSKEEVCRQHEIYKYYISKKFSGTSEI